MRQRYGALGQRCCRWQEVPAAIELTLHLSFTESESSKDVPMMGAQSLLLCAVVPLVSAFIDEEGASFVQLTVEKNWNRGKVRQPLEEPSDMEDDISFMQTRVSSEHRIGHKPAPAHRSYDVHHMMAGVTPDGDVDVVEQGVSQHRDRPPLSDDGMGDEFSLMQTTVQHRTRSEEL